MYVLYCSRVIILVSFRSRNGDGKRTTLYLYAVLSPLCYTRTWDTAMHVENWLTLGDNYRSDGPCAVLYIDFAATSHTHLRYHIPRYVVYCRFASVAPVKWPRERKVTKNSGKHNPGDHSYFRSSKLMLLQTTHFVKQACYVFVFENVTCLKTSKFVSTLRLGREERKNTTSMHIQTRKCMGNHYYSYIKLIFK